MPKWESFKPAKFEYDFENDKLHIHHLTLDEAVQCFSREFKIRSNKKYSDRYKLLGMTDSGKKVCIIFQLKRGNVVRIITGWKV